MASGMATVQTTGQGRQGPWGSHGHIEGDVRALRDAQVPSSMSQAWEVGHGGGWGRTEIRNQAKNQGSGVADGSLAPLPAGKERVRPPVQLWSSLPGV